MNEVELILKASPLAAKLYLFLDKSPGKREFSSSTLAELFGVQRGAIERVKAELVSYGLVETDTVSKTTGYYLPHERVNVLPEVDVRAPLNPPLESLHNVKSEATVTVVSAPMTMGKGAHVGRVLHAYVAAFPNKPTPSPSQIQQWITAITVDPLVDMIDRMGGKDIASPVGYVSSAVRREAEKRKEQGAPDGNELEEERARGIALARMGARQHGEENVQQSSISDRRKRAGR